MAIKRTYINDDLDTLVEFIEDSDIFSSVSNDNNTIICKDSSDNTLLTIAVPTAANGTLVVTAYASPTMSASANWSYYKSGSIGVCFTYAYSCKNGIIISLQNAMLNDYWHALLITKNNNDVPVIVFTNLTNGNSSANVYKSFFSISWGDIAPLTASSFISNAKNQTVIVPFITNNDYGMSSYTPQAGYVQVGQFYTMGYGIMTINGINYLTNGYWAIEDE